MFFSIDSGDAPQWSSTDPSVELTRNPDELVCDRCRGPMPHGYEVPPIPIGGWMKEMREDIIRIKDYIMNMSCSD